MVIRRQVVHERIIKVLKPSRWIFLGWYLLGMLIILSTWIGSAFIDSVPIVIDDYSIIAVPMVVIGIIVIISAEILRGANRYYITTTRIMHEYSLFSRKRSSATYRHIQDLHATQGILERLIGIGTLHINTAGTHLTEITFKGVPKPFYVKRMIIKMITQR